MATREELEAAVQRVNSLPSTPGTSDMLALYALYKQATVGDVTGSRPGMLDVRGRAKWDAWAAKKGMSREAAGDAYLALATRLGA
ncbi:MAG: acyl-CoA-binding protein [Myxococcales bacterium]|nr:acyl-CoA-binding protein [Myxococcales bacterium]